MTGEIPDVSPREDSTANWIPRCAPRSRNDSYNKGSCKGMFLGAEDSLLHIQFRALFLSKYEQSSDSAVLQSVRHLRSAPVPADRNILLTFRKSLTFVFLLYCCPNFGRTNTRNRQNSRSFERLLRLPHPARPSVAMEFTIFCPRCTFSFSCKSHRRGSQPS